MKKTLLLLLTTVSIYGQTLQNPTFGNVKLKNNTTDNSATKVNVQSTDGTINTIAKNDLIDVVEVNYVPSLPLIGEAGKIYVVKNLNKIYRWNGTFHQELSVTDITYQSVIDALTFTPENVANKSDSYSVSSTVTYPNTKALVDGLVTKISGTLTTNRIPKSFGTKSIGDSSLNDNGSEVSTNLPIHANSFVKSIGSANILLAGGTDITQLSLPVSTATQTALNLKANLASPALTGTPTAPTATAGTNTTQIATTAFVTGAISTADSGNVKLTGNQTITGVKTFNTSTASTSILSYNNSTSSGITSDNSSTGEGFFSNNISTGTGFYSNNTSTGRGISSNNTSTGRGISSNNTSTGTGISSNNTSTGNGIVSNSTPTGTGFNYVGQNNGTNTFTVDKFGATTAKSFIKSSAPTTNILLAGGGDIAQNTAFNKPFGITAGTVVEGNYPPAKDGTGATGTWGINISGNATSATNVGGLLPSQILYGKINSGTNDGRFNANAFTKTGFYTAGGGSSNVPESGRLMVMGYDEGGESFRGNILLGDSGQLWSRTEGGTANSWTSWRKLWDDGNFNPANYLPLSGGTLTGIVTATSYTATSLPVFENNAAASSLAVGQFYRTSTGVLMVKF